MIKDVEVKRRSELAPHPGYQPLWVIVRLAPGYTFENYLDWPEYEDNWPQAVEDLVVEMWNFIPYYS